MQFSVVGPGRAGQSFSVALDRAGWTKVAEPRPIERDRSGLTRTRAGEPNGHGTYTGGGAP